MTIAAILAFTGAVLAQALVFFGILSAGNLAPLALTAVGIILILFGIMADSDRKA